MSFRSIFIRRFLLAIVAIAVSINTSWVSYAQEVQYQEDATKAELKELTSASYRKWKKDVADIISKGVADPKFAILSVANKNRFTGYLGGLYFPRMTQLDQLSKLPEHRAEFLQLAYQCGSKNPPALKVLNKFTAEKMIKIANDKKYHPAARHNATIILGLLDKKTIVRKRIPAVPYYDVIKPAGGGKGLLKIALDPEQNSAVRVAALAGIKRHAKSVKIVAAATGVPAGMAMIDGLKVNVNEAMEKLLTDPTLTEKLSFDGRTWLMRDAAEILAEFGMPGSGNANVKALAGVIGNEQVGVSARSAAARALSRIGSLSLNGVDSNKLCGDFAKLAQAILMDEHTRSEKANRSVSTNTIKYFMTDVYIGLAGADGKGGIAIKAGGDQPMCSDLAAALKTILANENIEIASNVNIIQTWLKKNKFIEPKAAASDSTPDTKKPEEKSPLDEF